MATSFAKQICLAAVLSSFMALSACNTISTPQCTSASGICFARLPTAGQVKGPGFLSLTIHQGETLQVAVPIQYGDVPAGTPIRWNRNARASAGAEAGVIAVLWDDIIVRAGQNPFVPDAAGLTTISVTVPASAQLGQGSGDVQTNYLSLSRNDVSALSEDIPLYLNIISR
jgi:hypothetical protein